MRRRLADGSLGTVRWRVRFKTPTGERRSRSFRRRVDTERYASVVETDKARGEFVDPRLGALKLKDFVDRYFVPTLVGPGGNQPGP
jgi:hypothetical protein